MNKHPLHFARWSVILDNSNIKESAEEWTKVHSSLFVAGFLCKQYISRKGSIVCRREKNMNR